MNANMQQWAGAMQAQTEAIAHVILTSHSEPTDLRILNSLLISVRCTAEAMKAQIEKGQTE